MSRVNSHLNFITLQSLCALSVFRTVHIFNSVSAAFFFHSCWSIDINLYLRFYCECKYKWGRYSAMLLVTLVSGKTIVQLPSVSDGFQQKWYAWLNSVTALLLETKTNKQT